MLDDEEGEAVKIAAGSELQDGDETLETVRTNSNNTSKTTVTSCAGSVKRKWLKQKLSDRSLKFHGS